MAKMHCKWSEEQKLQIIQEVEQNGWTEHRIPVLRQALRRCAPCYVSIKNFTMLSRLFFAIVLFSLLTLIKFSLPYRGRLQEY